METEGETVDSPPRGVEGERLPTSGPCLTHCATRHAGSAKRSPTRGAPAGSTIYPTCREGERMLARRTVRRS